MAQIVYAWNPFQQVVDNRITDEVIKTSEFPNRVEFVPRAAPFFSRNFELYRQGSNTPLKLGYDYCFAHSFDMFIDKYNRNVFGSVVMLRPVAGDVLIPKYDTIGAGFVLDQVAFAELVGNIINAPRVADWAELDGPTIPTEFPEDPHDHPINQSYDYQEMITQLKSLILAVTDNGAEGVTMKDLLEQHLAASLVEAHAANKADIGIPLTPNMSAATVTDLAGNSANLLVTMNVYKEGMRQLAAGTLNLGTTDGGTPGGGSPGGGASTPSAPTQLNVESTVKQGTSNNVLTVSGGAASDGTTITYSLVQTGAVAVTFSKTSGILPDEQITFSVPVASNDVDIVISALVVDAKGAVSPAKSALVTLLKHAPPSAPTTLQVPSQVFKNTTGNILKVSGSTASDGATITYEISQSGSIPVTFSKVKGIAAKEAIAFSVPGVVPGDTPLEISVTAVDSQGGRSPAKVQVITISVAPTKAGVPYGGGFFVGRYKDYSGKLFDLVVSPKAFGEYIADFYATYPANGTIASDAYVYVVGPPGSLSTATGVTGWRVPTMIEMEMCYRFFKPTTDQNRTVSDSGTLNSPGGSNSRSVPPGPTYTATNPAQTDLDDWKEGGSEAFQRTGYGTNDKYASNGNYTQNFINGSRSVGISAGAQIKKVYVRAVRAIPVVA